MLAWICWGGVPIIGLTMFLNPGDIMKNALDNDALLVWIWTWLPDHHPVKERRIGLNPLCASSSSTSASAFSLLLRFAQPTYSWRWLPHVRCTYHRGVSYILGPSSVLSHRI